MNRSLIGWIVAAVLAIGGAATAYLFFLAGGSGEPSTVLTTPEVVTTTNADNGVTTSTDGNATTTGESGSGTDSFVIDSEQTTASFEIGEVLRGEPTTVVGTTDQVAGQVVVGADDLGTAQFSEVVINARTLQTDSDRRDRAMRGPGHPRFGR
jgi:hypothetical protein